MLACCTLKDYMPITDALFLFGSIHNIHKDTFLSHTVLHSVVIVNIVLFLSMSPIGKMHEIYTTLKSKSIF